jgi:hypothetical protein
MKTGCFIEYLREMENLLFLSVYPQILLRNRFLLLFYSYGIVQQGGKWPCQPLISQRS